MHYWYFLVPMLRIQEVKRTCIYSGPYDALELDDPLVLPGAVRMVVDAETSDSQINFQVGIRCSVCFCRRLRVDHSNHISVPELDECRAVGSREKRL